MAIKDVVWHNGHVTREDRNRLNRHKSGIIWLTGLPGAGKSTIAHQVEKELYKEGIRAYVLDGDNIRHGLNADLEFNRESRRENIRRVVEVSKLFMDAGLIVLTAFISPFANDRASAREYFAKDFFYEVFIRCPIEECEKRDTKGHYRKARAGIIKEYTGVSAPYEPPEHPDLIIDTNTLDLKNSVQSILDFVKQVGLIAG